MAKKNPKQFSGPPPPEGGRGQPSPWPFKKWKPGKTQRFDEEHYKAIRNAVQNLNRDPDVRYRYAKVLENGKQWVRVWRVE